MRVAISSTISGQSARGNLALTAARKAFNEGGSSSSSSFIDTYLGF